MTKQKRMVVCLIGVVLLMGMAVLIASTHSTTVAASNGENVVAMLTSQSPQNSFKLQCGVKVPDGLAQCGSQASSCKNCHEVKGEDAVNAKGDWHISHAFGDFCEFCHGGNVQAPDKAAAHQGLVQPLGDVKTNCSSCHTDDYQARAEKYASALGVKVGSGGSQPPIQPAASSVQPAQPIQPVQPAAQQPAPRTAPVPSSASSNEVVDYNQPAGAISTGNLIVGLLLAVTVIGGGAFIYWNEKRLRRLMPRVEAGYVTFETALPQDVRVQSSDAVAAEPLGKLSPELAKLLPVLQSHDPRTLRALRIILADRKRGEDLLQSLSLINFSVLEEMKRLDKKELSLLLALASES